MKFLIGCDPEVFVRDRKTGKFVSAHGLIPGTKRQPHPVDHGAVQVDGNALEFNIDPADSKSTWVRNINVVFEQLRRMLPEHLEAVVVPIADFDPAYFNALPDVCKELGCDPDFNAYTGEINVRPRGDAPVRGAGGHIHGGWTNGVDIADTNHRLDCHEFGKQMDYYFGIWTLLFDKDARRREMYGKAGAIRYKPYGCEYRTPSNMWLTDQNMIGWAWDATYAAMRNLAALCVAAERHGNLAREIINNNQTEWPTLFGGVIINSVPGIYLPPGGLFEAAAGKKKKG